MFASKTGWRAPLRKALWSLCILGILLTTAGVGIFVVLAALGPFQYGDAGFYSLQRWTEKTMVNLDNRPGGKAQHLLDLAVRRNQDLGALLETPLEPGALFEVEQGVYQAVVAITRADPADFATLRPQLQNLLEYVQSNLSSLKIAPAQDPSGVAAFQAWEGSMLQAVRNPNQALGSLLEDSPAPAGSSFSNGSLALSSRPNQDAFRAEGGPGALPTGVPIDPHFVYFPADSKGARHEFFPLSGKHAEMDCKGCHSAGKFAGTPTGCADCHRSLTPANHFPGDCATCHNAAAWKEIHFDHAANQAADCQSCHRKNAPPNHYPAQCSACHTTTAWKPASFNHSAVNTGDCQNCHAKTRPADHFPGQCSQCHSTQAWKPAGFNHQGNAANDCAGCHNRNKPANHFEGQCSACHSSSAWKPARFDHAAVEATDCQTCHTKDKPADHFAGQCSACHTTNAWKPATFNHAAMEATDCLSCHTADRPANHYTWQCSECHTTSAWSRAPLNHPFPMDHGSANGVCASCHSSNTKAWSCFTCHDKATTDTTHKDIPGYASDCTICHPAGKRP